MQVPTLTFPRTDPPPPPIPPCILPLFFAKLIPIEDINSSFAILMQKYYTGGW